MNGINYYVYRIFNYCNCTIPIYILVISRLNIRLSTALFIYAYRAIFSIGYLTYAKYDFADANKYIRGFAEGFRNDRSGIVLRFS